MYCKNCGAEYEEHLAECPYCGAENYKKSVDEHYKVIDDYQEKTEKLHTLPQRATQKATKIIAIVFVVIVVIGIGGPLVAGRIQAAESEREYEQRLETLRELEEVYQAGKYLELFQMWRDEKYNRYEGTYQKYWRVAELADSVEGRLELVEMRIDLAISADELATEGAQSMWRISDIL